MKERKAEKERKSSGLRMCAIGIAIAMMSTMIVGTINVRAAEENSNTPMAANPGYIVGPPQQLTTNNVGHVGVAIWKNTVVWIDDRNGDFDIYTRQIGSNNAEYRITTDPVAHRFDVDVWENRVVWAEVADYASHIYMYYLGPDGIPDSNDISTEGLYQITNDPYSYNQYCRINNNYIVYEGQNIAPYQPFQVYVYNLGPDGIPGTGDGEYTKWISPGAYPSIWGDKIVYNTELGTGAIYTYNLTTNQNTLIESNGYAFPQIYRNKMTYYTYNLQGEATGDMWYYDFNDGSKSLLATDINPQFSRTIYGGILVYTKNNNELYIYDVGVDEKYGTVDDVGEKSISLTTPTKYPVTIYNNKLTWINWDNALGAAIWTVDLMPTTLYCHATATKVLYFPNILQMEEINVWVFDRFGSPVSGVDTTAFANNPAGASADQMLPAIIPQTDATGWTAFVVIFNGAKAMDGVYTVTLLCMKTGWTPSVNQITYDMPSSKGSAIDQVRSVILSLPDDAFNNNPAQRKNTLLNKLDAVESQIMNGAYQGAINKLQNDIRSKADGYIDGNLNNDWIIDPVAQAELTTLIDGLISTLELIL